MVPPSLGCSSQKSESHLKLSFPLMLPVPPVIKNSRVYHPHLSRTQSSFPVPAAPSLSVPQSLSPLCKPPPVSPATNLSLSRPHHTAFTVMCLKCRSDFFKSLAQSASVNFPTSLCPFVQPVALDATTRAKRLLSFLDTCPVKLAPQCKLCAFFRAWSASLIPFVTLHMLFIPSRMPPTCLVVLQDSAQGHFFRGFPTSLSSLPPRTCACQLNTFPVYWIP